MFRTVVCVRRIWRTDKCKGQQLSRFLHWKMLDSAQQLHDHGGGRRCRVVASAFGVELPDGNVTCDTVHQLIDHQCSQNFS